MMSNSFVPFVPPTSGADTPGGKPVFRMKVLPSATPAGQSQGTIVPVTPETPHPKTAGEPKITVERNGDQVSRIIVECPCGHVIELVCTQ
jgi:hypothetical protein